MAMTCAKVTATIGSHLAAGLALPPFVLSQLVSSWMMNVMVHEGHQVLCKPAPAPVVSDAAQACCKTGYDCLYVVRYTAGHSSVDQ